MFISKGYKGIYDLYFVHSLTGKRSKVSTGKTTKKEAEGFLLKFAKNLNNLPKTFQPKTYFTTLRNEILKYADNNFTTKTKVVYDLASRNLLRVLGNRELSKFRLKDFEDFKCIRVKEVSQTSVNIEIRTIKAMFNYAVRMGYIEANPMRYIRQFSIPQQEKLSFSDSEIKRVLQIIKDIYFRNLIVFTLLTGCRINEVLNIQVQDIDFSEKTLTIKNKADFKVKTGRIRYIPISKPLEDLLHEILCYSGNIIELSSPEKYLFHNSRNMKKLNANYVSKKFKTYLRQAGLPEKFHFHCLRHTFITNLIKKGVNINFAKLLAGHSDINTTMGYIHIETEDLREAVNLIKIAY